MDLTLLDIRKRQTMYIKDKQVGVMTYIDDDTS